MSINVAIVGCSKIAHLHAKAILQIPMLNFKAVWSRTPDSAQKFADAYKVKAYGSITGKCGLLTTLPSRCLN